MIELTDEERATYIYFSQFHKNEGAFARHLVDALRRAVAEVLRLEFEQSHNDERCTMPLAFSVENRCTDPRHDYKRADWEREADRVIREGR